jgi:DNA-binding NtrC family response regulator
LAAPTIRFSRSSPQKSDVGELQVAVMGPNFFGLTPLPPRGTLTIGRAEDADVRVVDANASRLHAKLHVDASGDLFVEDLGTKNGTYLRETLIPPNERVPFQPGESIRIGFAIIMIQRRSLAPQTRRTRSHATFEERLQEACEVSERSGATFAIARLRLGVDQEGRSTGGHAVDVISSGLRSGDLLAQYAPADYELLLPDTTPEKARALAAELRRRLEGASMSSQLSMAFFPADGRTPDELVEKANGGLGARADDDDDDAPVVRSEGMRRLYKTAGRAAVGHGSDGLIGVLLLGECGVGKDVLARWIHAKSPRAEKPFVSVNCGAFTETLLNSELFGHERGAFTDAKAAKAGILESAAGGTVFLDEIGDMPLHLQVRLLHAIQNRKITRVGDAARERAIDVRFVAATNRDLPTMVSRGAFREDLYYRLNQITLTVPPLRERADEIESLAKRFLARAGGPRRRPPRLSSEALDVLRSYVWPGNVRELRNMIDRALVLCEGPEIRAEHLDLEKIRTTRFAATVTEPTPAPARAGRLADADTPAPTVPPPPDDLSPKQLDERARIIATLAECSYNQKLAATKLGFSRGTLFSRMKRYGIPGPRASAVHTTK